MALCFVSLGSNIERGANLRAALTMLHAWYGPLLLSAVYETTAVGFEGAPFYNLVAAFVTDDRARAVAAKLADIERERGRARGEARFGPRTLDLDLLLYGDAVMNEAELKLPRADIERHGFVLEPLAEIAPDLTHPVTGRRYAELWREFGGKGAEVKTTADL